MPRVKPGAPVPATLTELMGGRAARDPDTLYFHLFDEGVPYGRLWRESARYAAGLRRAGIDRGDKVCLIFPTCAEFFYTFFGALRLGAVPVPLYPTLGVEATANVFRDSEAKAVATIGWFRKDVEETARRFETDGMVGVASFYTKGPTRVQFMDKDPKGWQEFYDQFTAQSAKGHALTMRGVQMSRPSIFDLEAAISRLEVPTLIMTGDEDDPCLEPAIFMKRKIPTAGLAIIPKSGHTINLEEPEAFNRALLDFLTAVDAGRWTRRNPASLAKSAILPNPSR